MPSKKQRLQQLAGNWTASELCIQYKPGVKSNISIKHSLDAYHFIRSLWDKERLTMQEELMAFFFNRKGRTIGYRLICIGNMTSTHADIRLIVSLALHSLAAGVIIAHNHPSGDLEPSDADLAITKKLGKALKLIDVRLLDHLIIGECTYYSMADENLL